MKQAQKTPLAKRDALRYAANLMGAAVLVYLVVNAVVRAVNGVVLEAFSKGKEPPDSISAACYLALVCAGLLCAIWLLRHFSGSLIPGPLRYLDPKDVRLWLFLPVFLGLGMLGSVLTAQLQALLTKIKIYEAPAAYVLPKGVFPMLLAFLALCVAPAILEEMLCRGLLQRMLARWGVLFSVCVSSLVFTLLHGDIAQMPTVFLLSVFLGLTAHATNSLLPSTVLHFCNNAVVFLLLCAQQKMEGAKGLGVAVYVLFLLLLAAAVCGVFIARWRLLSTLRPVPVRHNPANRQNRLRRMLSAPVYVVMMAWLVWCAIWPLLPFGKGAAAGT